jgi:hypothetical protein
MKPPEIRRAPRPRPANQRWIKRPPRPSRGTPLAFTPRQKPKPGLEPFLMALGTGIAVGIMAAILTPFATDRQGMVGLATGLGFAGGFVMVWRGLGFTMDQVKDVFR